MSWEDTADLVMQGINSSVLSEDALYCKKNSLEWFTIQGVFSRQYIGIDSDTGNQFVGQRPVFTVRDADVPDGPQTMDKVEIRGSTYRVDRKEVDGQGAGTTLFLKKIE